jgi:hypothetical protein
MRQRRNTKRFVVCVRNEGYPAALELRKIYEQIPDKDAEAEGEMRVIDESGEDYLFPADYFIVLDLPKDVAGALETVVEPEAQHR